MGASTPLSLGVLRTLVDAVVDCGMSSYERIRIRHDSKTHLIQTHWPLTKERVELASRDWPRDVCGERSSSNGYFSRTCYFSVLLICNSVLHCPEPGSLPRGPLCSPPPGRKNTWSGAVQFPNGWLFRGGHGLDGDRRALLQMSESVPKYPLPQMWSTRL